MPEQQVKAGQADEAEEILDVVFPSSDETAEVVHPGREAFHFPAFSIAAEFAAIRGMRPRRFGAISSLPYSSASFASSGSEGFVADEAGGNVRSILGTMGRCAFPRCTFYRPLAYSPRNACMGSTWVARSAGKNIAERDTSSRMPAEMQ